jgi:hypothetical protein
MILLYVRFYAATICLAPEAKPSFAALNDSNLQDRYRQV